MWHLARQPPLNSLGSPLIGNKAMVNAPPRGAAHRQLDSALYSQNLGTLGSVCLVTRTAMRDL